MSVARRLLVITVGIESVLLLGVSGWLLVTRFRGEVADPVASVAMAVLGATVGMALAWAAVRSAQRRWVSPVPVVLWQVFQVTIALPALRAAWLIGVALLVLSVVASGAAMRVSREPRASCVR